MESIWDKKRQGILRTLGIVTVLALVGANIWLLDKAAVPHTSGVGLSPANLGSFFNEGSKRVVWEQPHNILLLGRAGEKNNAPHLTDTILIIHADPKAEEIKLISLPRDLLVKLPNNEGFVKLNAFLLHTSEENAVNLEPIQKKISTITGLVINHTVLFDLATFEEIVDAIDGVVVHVPHDIYDPYFPADEGGYETFTLQSGWRHLDAQAAERFVRTRNTPQGDFDRITHQQELVRSVKGKLATLNPIWDFGALWSVYGAVQNNITTNLSVTDARALWNFASSLSLQRVESFVLNTQTGLLKPQTVQFGNETASTLVTTEEEGFAYVTIQKAIISFIEN